MDTLLADLSKAAGIFGLAFFYFWPAMPAGLALGLHPAVVVAATTLSYLCGAAVVLVPGGRVRAWIMRRYGQRLATHPDSFLHRVWDRFGVAGLGLLAPVTVGAQAGALLGVALNAPPRRLFLWMAFGALAWSVGITLAALLGLLAVS